MSTDLPDVIARYFASDESSSPAAVSSLFTSDAIVIDEGKSYRGRAAIGGWKADSSTRYTYTSTPFAFDEIDGRSVVTSRLVGTFPGSPINLRYIFDLEGDAIAGLEIVP